MTTERSTTNLEDRVDTESLHWGPEIPLLSDPYKNFGVFPKVSAWKSSGRTLCKVVNFTLLQSP